MALVLLRDSLQQASRRFVNDANANSSWQRRLRRNCISEKSGLLGFKGGEAVWDANREVWAMTDTVALRSAVRGSQAFLAFEKILFALALIFVGASSAYDGYLVVRTGDMIEQFERNPVGKYLIHFNNGDPSIFLRVKAAGTVLALFALSVLHRRSRRLASPVEMGLVLFQSGLLFYLENPF